MKTPNIFSLAKKGHHHLSDGGKTNAIAQDIDPVVNLKTHLN